MKKIIITILMSTLMILGIKNVDAMTMDGKYNNIYQINNTNEILVLINKNQPSKTVTFTSTPNVGNVQYAVFSIYGLEFVDNAVHPNTAYYQVEPIKTYLQIQLMSNQNWTRCEVQNNMIVCPVQSGSTITGLVIKTAFPTVWADSEWKLQIYLDNYVTTYTTGDNDIISQNHTYNNTPSEDLTNEETTMNDYSTRESTLMNSLDFSEVSNLDITINPNASSYIWSIVNRLRGMNASIIVLFSSVLGLGIIKMILNR